jgi:hypothetical protein
MLPRRVAGRLTRRLDAIRERLRYSGDPHDFNLDGTLTSQARDGRTGATPVPRHDRSRAIAAVLWVLVGALITFYLGALGLNSLARLLRPLDEFMYGESVVLDSARRVATGLPLYLPADQLPLTVAAYTPLYYLLVGGLLRLFGSDSYVVGREVSVAATLATASVLAWSVHRVTGRYSFGALAAGLFMTQNLTVLLWAPLHRVDMLAMCLTMTGLALATAGRTHSAALAFVLSFMTKQTFLAAPAAVFLALWPDRRRAIVFGALFVAILGLSMAAAQALSGGWFLWHTVLANLNPFHLETFAVTLGSFLQFNGLPVLIATALLSMRPRPAERLWRAYFVLSLLSVASVGKAGSSSNYWLEASAATAALLSMLCARQAAPVGADTMIPRAIGAALLIAVPGYQAVFRDAAMLLSWPRPVQTTAEYARMVRDPDFVAFLASEPGPLLTDDPGLAVAAGKPLLFEATIFKILAEQGYWDERPILKAVNARQFTLVVLTHPLDKPSKETRLTTTVRDALAASYAPTGESDGFWLYRPLAAAGPPSE